MAWAQNDHIWSRWCISAFSNITFILSEKEGIAIQNENIYTAIEVFLSIAYIFLNQYMYIIQRGNPEIQEH